jgi:hypothetical protein
MRLATMRDASANGAGDAVWHKPIWMRLATERDASVNRGGDAPDHLGWLMALATFVNRAAHLPSRKDHVHHQRILLYGHSRTDNRNNFVTLIANN